MPSARQPEEMRALALSCSLFDPFVCDQTMPILPWLTYTRLIPGRCRIPMARRPPTTTSASMALNGGCAAVNLLPESLEAAMAMAVSAPLLKGISLRSRALRRSASATLSPGSSPAHAHLHAVRTCPRPQRPARLSFELGGHAGLARRALLRVFTPACLCVGGQRAWSRGIPRSRLITPGFRA